MRRKILRQIFNLAAAVTLVMGVAVVPLWVRSYRCADHVTFIAAHTYLGLSFCQGQLHVELGGTASSSDVIWNTREPQYILLAGVPKPSIELFGFDFLHAVSSDWGHFDFWIIGMPYWFVMLLLGVLPVTWLRKRRRVAAGCCSNCGYDLRATPDRCPECGAVVGASERPPHNSPLNRLTLFHWACGLNGGIEAQAP